MKLELNARGGERATHRNGNREREREAEEKLTSRKEEDEHELEQHFAGEPRRRSPLVRR